MEGLGAGCSAYHSARRPLHRLWQVSIWSSNNVSDVCCCYCCQGGGDVLILPVREFYFWVGGEEGSLAYRRHLARRVGLFWSFTGRR